MSHKDSLMWDAPKEENLPWGDLKNCLFPSAFPFRCISFSLRFCNLITHVAYLEQEYFGGIHPWAGILWWNPSLSRVESILEQEYFGGIHPWAGVLWWNPSLSRSTLVESILEQEYFGGIHPWAGVLWWNPSLSRSTLAERIPLQVYSWFEFNFPSPRPVAIEMLKSLSYYLPIAGGENHWIHAFPKGISDIWNASSLGQGLNSSSHVHFLRW